MISNRQRLWTAVGVALVAPLVLIGLLLGALSTTDSALERIPVALVNNDEIIIDTDEAGEETFFLASRPLVVELVGGDDTGLNWVVTDSSRAATMLASGEVYAVFEIPADFSEKVQTLQTATPEQTAFTISINPARSYLTGVIAENIGNQVAAAVNKQFGEAAVEGLFGLIVDLGGGFSEAADGAAELASGTKELQSGVSQLGSGTRELNQGFTQFDSGLGQYLDGVGQLAAGLAAFDEQTKALPELADGVAQYTGGVSLFFAGLENQVAELDAAIAFLSGQIPQLEAGAAFDPSLIPVLEEAQGQLVQATIAREVFVGLLGNPDLSLLVASGETLSGEVSGAVEGIREGIVGSAAGAGELADAGRDLRAGSAGILQGTSELNSGVSELGDGVSQLVDGVDEFASALADGAEEISSEGAGELGDDTASTLVSPISSEVASENDTIGVGATLTTVIISVGIWLSALLLIVSLPIPSRRTLSSTVSSGHLVRRHMATFGVMGLVQAAVAITLLHTLGGFGLSVLPWSLPLVLAGVFAFAALHYAVWATRPQWVVPVSLAVLIAQIATFGVVLPPEILPPVYQAVAGWGPVSWLADALLGAAAADSPSRMAGGLVGLVLTGVVSLLVARILFGRSRHRRVHNYLLTGVSN